MTARNGSVGVPDLDLSLFKSELMAPCTFAERAFGALETITDDDARIRRIGPIKNLMEEILPLAVFARYFDMPERRVRCRYLGDSGTEPDGELVLSGRAVDLGFYPARIEVEATCAEDGKAYLRREALAKHGAVFAGANIARTGRRREAASVIVSRPEVRDGEAAPRDLGALVRAAIDKKVAKGYSPRRLLLVRIDPDFPVASPEMCDVVAAARPQNMAGLLAVFMVECSTGSVIQIA